MNDATARTLLGAERVRLEQLLGGLESEGKALEGSADDRGDSGDGADRLTTEENQTLVAGSLQRRLDAVERAEQRLAAGTYGRSIRSGLPIPDGRLEADPAAELLIEEATGAA